ncbi:MAG: cobalamin-binding protein [Gammaproteobacteria bacterium]|nr:cobalamin-binding protein [Gammaproteobacteria bacterium]
MSDWHPGSGRAPRIVTLLPAATEIVCALGARDALVGRSHECDYPLGVEALPACTLSRLNIHGSSIEIDRDVRQLLADSLSLYEVNPDTLRALAPDVIVTQAQCEVCAVSLDVVEAALATWTGRRPTIVSLAPATLSDVWESFRVVGQAIGAVPRAEALAAQAAERVEAIAARTARTPPTRLACIEWLEPMMSAGNWMPELIAAAGAQDVFEVAAGAHSPWIDADILAKSAPDIILAMPCGFALNQTAQELNAWLARLQPLALPAVRNGRVAMADGSQYFNRPGPRLIQSLEILCEVLGAPYGGEAKFEGDAWRWAT